MRKQTTLQLQIGITDQCNYNCIMCQQSAHNGIYGDPTVRTPELHAGAKGFMSRDLFTKIIQDIVCSGLTFNTIALHWLGESLLHPDFSYFFRYICSVNKNENITQNIILFTNASLLTEEITDMIAGQCYNDTSIILVFSIDAATSSTYSLIHNNNRFYKVISNIEYFYHKTRHIDDIYRIYRFLVMKENYSEAVLFRERFSELTDSKYQLTFNEEKSFDMDGPRDIINFKRVYENDLEAAHRRHREVTENLGGKPTYFYSGDLQRPVCPAPFRTPIINWDGQMTVCCPDDRLELTIGNLNDNSFSELWFSEKADIFRQKILKKDYDKIDRCSRCGNYAGYPLKREEIQLYDKKYSKIN